MSNFSPFEGGGSLPFHSSIISGAKDGGSRVFMKSNKQSLSETLLSVAQIDPSLPSLDLHGLSVHEAELEVDHFLSQQLYRKERVVRIICGVGTGALADAIWEFVQKHPVVEMAKSKGSEIFVVL